MKRPLLKLIAGGLLLVVALVVLVSSSYAWFTVSSDPSVGGLQVTIGGSHTIRIAADQAVVTADGVQHYPGVFSDSLNLSRYEGYAYLQDMVGLTPVSTADGIHWFFPTYYDSDDGAFAGLEGQLRDIEEFLKDDTLRFANAASLPDDKSVHGGYAMVDFWVVSPHHCQLRLSMDEGNNGSYLVGTPLPVSDGNGGFVLDMDTDAVAAAARVGFLVDDRRVTDGSMEQYVSSGVYNSQYRSLRGVYQEPDSAWDYYPARFTIYEPNADWHRDTTVQTLTENGPTYVTCVNGSYVRTRPIAYEQGTVVLTDVLERTAVQRRAVWRKAGNGESLIQQIFNTYRMGLSSPKTEELYDGFYRGYLGYQCGAYLETSWFIKNSANLNRALNSDGVVSADVFEALTTAGASEDVIVAELEKDVPQRIRMFVWLEGQDVDCVNATFNGGLLLNLELAGSTD